MISSLTITLITIIGVLLIAIVIAFVYCKYFVKKWRTEENKGDEYYVKQIPSSSSSNIYIL